MRASITDSKISRAKNSSRSLPLKLSTKGFSQGLPGSTFDEVGLSRACD